MKKKHKAKFHDFYHTFQDYRYPMPTAKIKYDFLISKDKRKWLYVASHNDLVGLANMINTAKSNNGYYRIVEAQNGTIVEAN